MKPWSIKFAIKLIAVTTKQFVAYLVYNMSVQKILEAYHYMFKIFVAECTVPNSPGVILHFGGGALEAVLYTK